MDNEIKINSSLGNTKIVNDSKIDKRDHLEYLSVDSRGRKSSNCKAIRNRKGLQFKLQNLHKIRKEQMYILSKWELSRFYN